MKSRFLSVTLIATALVACAPKHPKTGDGKPGDGDEVQGRETHGGEVIASVFIAKGYKIYSHIALLNGQSAVLGEADLELFRKALGSTRVDPIPGPLEDSQGAVVDARTGDDPLNPGTKVIELDLAAWEHYFSGSIDVYKLVFHEYLWASGLDDTNYRISNSLGPIEGDDTGIGTWTPLPTVGAPRFALKGSEVVTTVHWAQGRFVVIDSGSSSSCAAVIKAHVFDPGANTWRTSIAPAELGLVSGVAATVLGDTVALWGGGCRDDDAARIVYRSTGALFNPATGTWEKLKEASAPKPRGTALLLAVGGKLAVWGGLDATGRRADGALYDPATQAWSAISPTDAPQAGTFGIETSRDEESELYGDLLLWRKDNQSCTPVVKAYRPSTGVWRDLKSADSPAFPCDWNQVVFTRTRFAFVFGEHYTGADGVPVAGILWDPELDRWDGVTAAGAPPRYELGSNVWTANGLVSFGGRDTDGLATKDGAAYITTENRWQALTKVNAPFERYSAQAVWTGADLYVWGGLSLLDKPMSSGAVWRP